MLDKAKEFLKDVRVEATKVTWPSRGELRESTVVVVVTIFISVLNFFSYLRSCTSAFICVPLKMEIPADSTVHIIIRCPQCGGKLDFLEEAQVIHCHFCGSNLLVAGREGVLRYVLPPRISEANKAQTLALDDLRRTGKRSPRIGETFLYYAPFWRIQGIVYRWVFGLKPLQMD